MLLYVHCFFVYHPVPTTHSEEVQDRLTNTESKLLQLLIEWDADHQLEVDWWLIMTHFAVTRRHIIDAVRDGLVRTETLHAASGADSDEKDATCHFSARTIQPTEKTNVNVPIGSWRTWMYRLVQDERECTDWFIILWTLWITRNIANPDQ